MVDKLNETCKWLKAGRKCTMRADLRILLCERKCPAKLTVVQSGTKESVLPNLS